MPIFERFEHQDMHMWSHNILVIGSDQSGPVKAYRLSGTLSFYLGYTGWITYTIVMWCSAGRLKISDQLACHNLQHREMFRDEKAAPPR